MNKLALDVDGVLADFYLAACRRYGKPVVKTWWGKDLWIKEALKDLHDDYDFWRHLPILSPPESITFDFDCYVTSIDLRNKQAREDWLIMNGFPEKPVYVSSDKINFCESKNITHLIDDCPYWVSSDKVTVIPFIPSYLQTDQLGVRHLSEVSDFIKRNYHDEE